MLQLLAHSNCYLLLLLLALGPSAIASSYLPLSLLPTATSIVVCSAVDAAACSLLPKRSCFAVAAATVVVVAKLSLFFFSFFCMAGAEDTTTIPAFDATSQRVHLLPLLLQLSRITCMHSLFRLFACLFVCLLACWLVGFFCSLRFSSAPFSSVLFSCLSAFFSLGIIFRLSVGLLSFDPS
jgi:hypothetical protein